MRTRLGQRRAVGARRARECWAMTAPLALPTACADCPRLRLQGCGERHPPSRGGTRVQACGAVACSGPESSGVGHVRWFGVSSYAGSVSVGSELSSRVNGTGLCTVSPRSERGARAQCLIVAIVALVPARCWERTALDIHHLRRGGCAGRRRFRTAADVPRRLHIFDRASTLF